MMRILVVDNNVELCSILTEFFDSQPDMETVGVAYDGEEALTKLLDLKPDVMILDITMPHLDGIGVLERLEKIQLDDPRPHIIVLTAFGRDELVSRLTELGVDYFIVKPFNLAMLAERIRQFAQEDEQGLSHNHTTYQELPKYQRRNINETNEKRITKILHEMGVPPHFKGFIYLRDAAMMCQSRGYVGGALTKEIYPTLAQKYNATVGGVEAAIRNAVVTAWKNGNTDYIISLCGVHLGDRVPTNSLIIAKLAEEITVA